MHQSYPLTSQVSLSYAGSCCNIQGTSISSLGKGSESSYNIPPQGISFLPAVMISVNDSLTFLINQIHCKGQQINFFHFLKGEPYSTTPFRPCVKGSHSSPSVGLSMTTFRPCVKGSHSSPSVGLSMTI